MKTIGLTGGIGAGKSSAAACLIRHGIRVVDTDEVARALVEPEYPALSEIHSAFGDAVFDASGRLDRGALASIVFADADRRRELEAILHPRIRQSWKATLQAWRVEGAREAVVVIPLLFETHQQGDFDLTVCVACSHETQEARLLARGWTPEEIRQRIAAQLTVAQKITRADRVIWNESPLSILESQTFRACLGRDCPQLGI